MKERQGQVNGEPFIGHFPVLTGNGYGYMLPAFTPALRQIICDPFRALCDHEEGAVRSLMHHIPGFIPPFIRILMEEIGRKAGVYVGSGGDLVSSFVLSGA